MENVLFEIGEYSDLSNQLQFLDEVDEIELEEDKMAERIASVKTTLPPVFVSKEESTHIFYHQQIEPVKLLHPKFYMLLEDLAMTVRPFFFRKQIMSLLKRFGLVLHSFSPTVLLGLSFARRIEICRLF